MKVLILGAKGMLGTALCRVFDDFDPICWDKEEIDITRIIDVRDKLNTLRGALGHDEFVIMNAAAYTDVDGAESNREAAFAVNEKGVGNIAASAKAIGAKLVHYSTDYVFPGDTKEGYAEDHAPGPAVNVYGESKLAGERKLLESGAKYYLVRTAWLYGPNGKNFVDTMLGIAQTRKLVSVVNDQHGSPTFTKDVAEATRTLLDGEYMPGIYHAVNDGVSNWFEFAQKVFEYADANISVEPISSAEFVRPAKRPQYSVLLNTRGPKLRGWEEALKEYVSGIQDEPYSVSGTS